MHVCPKSLPILNQFAAARVVDWCAVLKQNRSFTTRYWEPSRQYVQSRTQRLSVVWCCSSLSVNVARSWCPLQIHSACISSVTVACSFDFHVHTSNGCLFVRSQTATSPTEVDLGIPWTWLKKTLLGQEIGWVPGMWATANIETMHTWKAHCLIGSGPILINSECLQASCRPTVWFRTCKVAAPTGHSSLLEEFSAK